MKDEIIAGLKNALDHGDSLESAVDSFITAGYNPMEVREAAKFLGQGATSITSPSYPQPAQKLPQQNLQQSLGQNSSFQPQTLPSMPSPIGAPQQSPPQNPLFVQPNPLVPSQNQYNQPTSNPKANSKKLVLIILLVFILLLLMGAIAFVLLKGDMVASWFG